ncbi:MAG: hypothetical protein KDA24_24020 [Deltaproteobacteria bacterium]|nr:hypothetical protein [Deltaproteobacteria bacterium]
MEANQIGQPGTAEGCRDFMDGRGSEAGWCVGDGQTEPEPGVWDDSPFSVGRGFDIIVPTHSMEIVFTTNHGTPGGNENLTGDEVLDAVIDAVETAREQQ